MPRKPRASQGASNNEELVCTVYNCNTDMGAEQTTNYGKFPGWVRGPVLHCEGSTLAFGCRRIGIVHHGHKIYSCPVCQLHLGCTHCVNNNPLCMICHVYADGSRVMPHDKGKKALELVHAVLDKRLTTEQALDMLEHLGTEAKNA